MIEAIPIRAQSTIGRRYGWRPQLPDQRDLVFARHVPSGSLPILVDLRSQMPGVYDQGQLGSCTANMGAGAYEYESMRQGGPAVTPSRLFLYYNERLADGTVDQDSGASIRDAFISLNTYGVCPESEWAYDIDQFTTQPPTQCYTDALKDTAIKYEAVAQDTSLNAVRSALAGKLSVGIGFTVYESFESSQVASTGAMPMPAASEQVLGGHAVLVSGYDDKARMLIVRNSWGAQWGNGGYFFMPYAYLADPNLASDFWAIELVSA